MIVNFDPRTGRIEKQSKAFGKVSITVDDARTAWNEVGTITDSNLAFQRLARDFDFDVSACLKWYAGQSTVKGDDLHTPK